MSVLFLETRAKRKKGTKRKQQPRLTAFGRKWCVTKKKKERNSQAGLQRLFFLAQIKQNP